jgi:hypothetical protein
MPPLVLLFNF